MIYYGRFKVTSPFGLRYLNGQRDNHKGIDVVGIDDKHIRSVCGGTVAVSAMVDRAYDQTLTWQWGNYVRIDGDDGYKYYYCHMSERNVTVGKRVEAGDIIGIEGNTGYSFGSHCHFEVRDINGVSVCPASFLGIPNEEGEYEYNKEIKTGKTEDITEERADNEPSSWAKEAVEWARANRIMFGDENGDLKLHLPCTREQMTVFLYRLYNMLA